MITQGHFGEFNLLKNSCDSVARITPMQNYHLCFRFVGIKKCFQGQDLLLMELETLKLEGKERLTLIAV